MQLPACVLPPPRRRPNNRPNVSPEILRTPVGQVSPAMAVRVEDSVLLYLRRHGAAAVHDIADGISRGFYATRDAVRRLVALDQVEAIPGQLLLTASGLCQGRAVQTFRLVAGQGRAAS
jgi:hypothetical protein